MMAPDSEHMRYSTMKTIFENAFYVQMNMNDAFYWGCSDISSIAVEDLEDLEPLIDQLGWEVFRAYEAIKRGHDPDKSVMRDGTKYFEAKKRIIDLINFSDEMFLYHLKWELEGKIESDKKGFKSKS
jgi:hypothetical protein